MCEGVQVSFMKVVFVLAIRGCSRFPCVFWLNLWVSSWPMCMLLRLPTCNGLISVLASFIASRPLAMGVFVSVVLCILCPVLSAQCLLCPCLCI
jgi:hypothetical protein